MALKFGHWMTAKDVLRINASKWPEKTGLQDLYRSYTFKEWDQRACRLAHALADMGLKKGDRFAVLAHNCAEWLEIYAAAAKGGFICVPLMFRLTPAEMEYIINHCEAKVLIVQGGTDLSNGKAFPWIDVARKMQPRCPGVKEYISFAIRRETADGFIPYEELLGQSDAGEPETKVNADDIWVLMYTGGTTGKPKGVIKSHASFLAEYGITIYEQQFGFNDRVLLVMPCCHINSLYYSFVSTWVGGTVVVYNMVSFNPEELIRVLQNWEITFTSLVPTHYIMMLALPDKVKKEYDLSSVKSLLISSAPARKETKLAVLDMFKNARLYEAYGSTEAGIVTLLRPEEQLAKLGTIGREVIGTDIVRLYDEDGYLITSPNVVGELYSRSPMLFEGYWKEPEKTEAAMKGDYFSAGDMAYRDEDGYYVLVDRKANMIISGGENIYPSEVESVLENHPKIQDAAVIGTPHEKWGEKVTAIVILRERETATAEDILAFCKNKVASYKIPKKIIFISEAEMPRNEEGKILYRVLRERYGKTK